MIRNLVGVALAAVVALSAAGHAAPADKEAACTKESRYAATNRARLAACTALLSHETSPDARVRLLLSRSEAYFYTGARMRALLDLKEVERLAPDAPWLHFDRALTYATLGYQARAYPEIEQAMRQGLHSAAAYGVRGVIFAFQGRYGEAIRDLDISIAGDPAAPGGYGARGFAELENGDIARAIPDFDRAIRLSPTDADLYAYRGRAHFALDQYDEARADFERAERLAPGKTDAVEFLADIQATTAAPPPAPQADAAPNAPSKAVGRSHNCTAYYPLLSAGLAEEGDVLLRYDVAADGVISDVTIQRSSNFDRLDRAAVICVSRHWRSTPARQNGVAVASPNHQAIIRYVAYRAQPSDPRHGNTLASLGDYDQAIAEYSARLAAAPGDADVYFRRGFAHCLRGDFADAGRDFDKSLALKPGQDEVAAARALCRAPPG